LLIDKTKHLAAIGEMAMSKLFDCRVPGCDGAVDANNLCFLQIGGFNMTTLRFACGTCNRLHVYPEGDTVSTKDGKPIFRGPDGKPIVREA
jgi:hypothetical protein